jgi:hypothetical protein
MKKPGASRAFFIRRPAYCRLWLFADCSCFFAWPGGMQPLSFLASPGGQLPELPDACVSEPPEPEPPDEPVPPVEPVVVPPAL